VSAKVCAHNRCPAPFIELMPLTVTCAKAGVSSQVAKWPAERRRKCSHSGENLRNMQKKRVTQSFDYLVTLYFVLLRGHSPLRPLALRAFSVLPLGTKAPQKRRGFATTTISNIPHCHPRFSANLAQQYRPYTLYGADYLAPRAVIEGRRKYAAARRRQSADCLAPSRRKMIVSYAGRHK